MNLQANTSPNPGININMIKYTGSGSCGNIIAGVLNYQNLLPNQPALGIM